MKLFTIIGLIIGLCALQQDAEARRMGGGKGMEEAPEQPLRFRRALMKGFAHPPPPEDAPQGIEDAPEQPFRARRSVNVAGEPEQPMDDVAQQHFRVRRQLPGMPDMPDMPAPPGRK